MFKNFLDSLQNNQQRTLTSNITDNYIINLLMSGSMALAQGSRFSTSPPLRLCVSICTLVIFQTNQITITMCSVPGKIELSKKKDEAIRMAQRTAVALREYAETGDIRYLLLVQRHLASIQNENGDL